MGDTWYVLAALAVLVLPMLLAGWLLRRDERRRGRRLRGKMPPK